MDTHAAVQGAPRPKRQSIANVAGASLAGTTLESAAVLAARETLRVDLREVRADGEPGIGPRRALA